MAKDKIVCCSLCGRDTANKTGICSRCYGLGCKSEEYGRKRLPVDQSSMEYAEPLEGRYEETSAELYHGESIRDDI